MTDQHPGPKSWLDEPTDPQQNGAIVPRGSLSSTSSSIVIKTNSFKIINNSNVKSSNRHSPTCAAEELMVLGGVLTNMGKYMDAQECYDKALQVCQDYVTDRSNHEDNIKNDDIYDNKSNDIDSSNNSILDTVESTSDVETYPDGQALMNLAHLSVKYGKFDEARDLYSKALDQHYNIYGNDAKTSFAGDVWVQLGRLSSKEKKYHEALCYFERALEIKVSVYEGQDANPQNDDLATTLECLGQITNNLQKYADSLDYFKRSLKMYYAIHGSPRRFKNKRVLRTMSSKLETLGRLSQVTGEYEASRIFYNEALMLKWEFYGDKANNTDLSTSLSAVGNIHRILGDYENARKYFTQELTMLHRVYGQEAKAKEIANTLHCLGDLHCNLNQFSQADDYYKQALDMKLQCFGYDAKNLSLAKTLHSLGILTNELGRYNEAENYFVQSLGMKQHVYGKDAKNATIANTINRLEFVVTEGYNFCL